MIHESLKNANFPMKEIDKHPEILSAVKKVYNLKKKQRRKESRQALMDESVIEVYRVFKHMVDKEEEKRHNEAIIIPKNG